MIDPSERHSGEHLGAVLLLDLAEIRLSLEPSRDAGTVGLIPISPNKPTSDTPKFRTEWQKTYVKAASSSPTLIGCRPDPAAAASVRSWIRAKFSSAMNQYVAASTVPPVVRIPCCRDAEATK